MGRGTRAVARRGPALYLSHRLSISRRTQRIPLKLYFHPLSSFCQKALIALYENDTPFEPEIVDLGNEASRAAFLKIWPIGRFPVLRNTATDRTIPESTIIIEYLAQRHPGRTPLVPADPDLARQARLQDRFYDLYVNVPMQKVVTDKLRPPGKNDPHGVEQAALLQTALGMIDHDMAAKMWAVGDAFTWPTAPPHRRCSTRTSSCRSARHIGTLRPI